MATSKHPRSNIHQLDPFELRISPAFNGRFRDFKDSSLRPLAESIAAGGLHQPISVLKLGSDHITELAHLGITTHKEVSKDGDTDQPLYPRDYFVVFGNRRARACQYGIREGILPSDFRIKSVMFSGSIADAVAANAAENAEREDTNLLDKAKSVKHLIDTGHKKGPALKLAGIHSRGVSASALLRLLYLPVEAQAEIEKGTMGLEVASNLAAIRDEDECLETFYRMQKIAGRMKGSSVHGRFTPEVWYAATKERAPATAGKKDRTEPKPSIKVAIELLQFACNSEQHVPTRPILDWMEGRRTLAQTREALGIRTSDEVTTNG